MNSFENKIKLLLSTDVCAKVSGKGGGGCINSGECYEIDDSKLIFVKMCSKSNAEEIISGEFQSLQTIKETNQINVPDALGIVRESDQVALLMSYVEMNSLNKLQGELGERLAKMHLYNQRLNEQKIVDDSYVGSNRTEDPEPITRFGFHCVTNCGAIAQNNEWHDDWVSFFARNRLQHQIRLIEENYNDRQINELWSELQLKIPKFFKPFSDQSIAIKPSLLHGDLW